MSASIVYDNDKYSVVKREPLQESAIAGLVGDADLVLLEGFKWSDYPKLILLTGSDEQNTAYSLLLLIVSPISLLIFQPNS